MQECSDRERHLLFQRFRDLTQIDHIVAEVLDVVPKGGMEGGREHCNAVQREVLSVLIQPSQRCCHIDDMLHNDGVGNEVSCKDKRGGGEEEETSIFPRFSYDQWSYFDKYTIIVYTLVKSARRDPPGDIVLAQLHGCVRFPGMASALHVAPIRIDGLSMILPDVRRP